MVFRKLTMSLKYVFAVRNKLVTNCTIEYIVPEVFSR